MLCSDERQNDKMTFSKVYILAARYENIASANPFIAAFRDAICGWKP